LQKHLFVTLSSMLTLVTLSSSPPC